MSDLLRSGHTQIISGGNHHQNAERQFEAKLPEEELFNLQLRFESFCRLVAKKQMSGRLHGIHREILGSYCLTFWKSERHAL